MMADGRIIGDGSWELTIFVTDLQVERTLRVKGDLHIGGVMLKLVEELDIAIDWSDHALWWPERNMWLTRTRSTLDQYGVQADAQLQFTPMHKVLRVQLPDLQYVEMKVDFSVKVFNAVITVCKELGGEMGEYGGIRHPEELSFQRPLTQDDLKQNLRLRPRIKRRPDTVSSPNSSLSNHNLSANSIEKSSPKTPNTPGSGGNISGPVTPQNTLGRPTKYNYSSSPFNGSLTPGSMNSLTFDSLNGLETMFATSPLTPSKEAKDALIRPRSMAEKARMNYGWLDSSLSIMEQDVRENDILLLRYKFFTFFDLNPKYDATRINQIYEQAKWSLLVEQNDCTEEEMMMFAALQLQVNLQSTNPAANYNHQNDDDIDAALTDLQVTLEGSSLSNISGDITQIPELADSLLFLKPKKFTLKKFRRLYFTFKDTHLSIYRSKAETSSTPAQRINLRGCEVNPDVNISAGKYGIKLLVPSAEGMSEMWIRCDSEQQYAKWMAACRLASKGKTMADSSYESEVSSILAFLSMQHPAPAPAINPSQLDLNPEDFVAPRFLKKLKGRQIATRILEAHANVTDLSVTDAKMNYIKAWQALPDYGITYFIVKFQNSKKEELIGVGYNRLMRLHIGCGEHIKTWRYNTMKAWYVNWEVKQVMVEFEEENVAFTPLSADCKVVHEFIGGYIFLSMRSKDQNQTLNEEMFHKLTGGWV